MGYADHIYTDEFGDTAVVIFRQDEKESRIATIIVRGATDNFLDDIERAIDDGINNFKVLSRDGRLVPGAGATEVELARQINQFADKCPGLDQYAIQRFAQALETFPRILSDNAGLKTTETVAALLAAHQEGKANTGICVDVSYDYSHICERNLLYRWFFWFYQDEGGLIDAVEIGVLDLFAAKYWGMKYATAAACTVLRVDQIIMAKRAGGPKPRDAGAQDADDD